MQYPNPKLCRFRKIGDSNGMLVSIEAEKDVEFNIKRVFYIFDTAEGVVRAKHAHRKSRQVIICVSGSCKVRTNNGKETSEFVLDRPDIGLFLDSMIWRELHDFSSGCVVLVLANDHYNPSECMNNYDEFMGIVDRK